MRNRKLIIVNDEHLFILKLTKTLTKKLTKTITITAKLALALKILILFSGYSLFIVLILLHVYLEVFIVSGMIFMYLFIYLFFFSIFFKDVTTDGKWCYIVFWVVGKPNTRWNLLKKRLLEVCPSYFSTSGIHCYFRPKNEQPKLPDLFLLKFWCSYDREGLLHGKRLFLINYEKMEFRL